MILYHEFKIVDRRRLKRMKARGREQMTGKWSTISRKGLWMNATVSVLKADTLQST